MELVDQVEQLPVLVIDIRNSEGVLGPPDEKGHARGFAAGGGRVRGLGHRLRPWRETMVVEPLSVYRLGDNGAEGLPAIQPSPIDSCRATEPLHAKLPGSDARQATARHRLPP